MMKMLRLILLAALAVFTFAAPAGASHEREGCKPLMDLPALEAEDCPDGIHMDLPGMDLHAPGKHVGDNFATPKPAPAGTKLPKTGLNAEQSFALGLAVLGVGGLLARRLKLNLG